MNTVLYVVLPTIILSEDVAVVENQERFYDSRLFMSYFY